MSSLSIFIGHYFEFVFSCPFFEHCFLSYFLLFIFNRFQIYAIGSNCLKRQVCLGFSIDDHMRIIKHLVTKTLLKRVSIFILLNRIIFSFEVFTLLKLVSTFPLLDKIVFSFETSIFSIFSKMLFSFEASKFLLLDKIIFSIQSLSALLD